MIFLRGTRAKVRPAVSIKSKLLSIRYFILILQLASLRRTISQQQEHYIDMQQDLHQKEIHLYMKIFFILIYKQNLYS
jgi:hypothetical protein